MGERGEKRPDQKGKERRRDREAPMEDTKVNEKDEEQLMKGKGGRKGRIPVCAIFRLKMNAFCFFSTGVTSTPAAHYKSD